MLKTHSEWISTTLPYANNALMAATGNCSQKTILQRTSSSLKATVFITRINGKCVVVKDYSESHPFIRGTLCRWFLQREIRAIKRLRLHPGVPEVLGKYGRYGFVLEMIEGKVLDEKTLKNNTRLIHKLEQTIQKMHQYGVTHNDIRNKNLILGEDQNLYIVDFASAISMPKSALSISYPLFSLARLSDRIKVVRFKLASKTETLNAKDKRLLKFVAFSKLLSKLWKNSIYKFLKF